MSEINIGFMFVTLHPQMDYMSEVGICHAVPDRDTEEFCVQPTEWEALVTLPDEVTCSCCGDVQEGLRVVIGVCAEHVSILVESMAITGSNTINLERWRPSHVAERLIQQSAIQKYLEEEES